MSQLHFLPDETTVHGAQRIALADLTEAIALLSDEQLAPAEAVHEARKKIKRLRALLRLLRTPLGAVYRRENESLRSTAHAMTGAREAAAALEALERLQQARPAHASPESFEQARQYLQKRAPRHRTELTELLTSSAAELERARERFSKLKLEGSGFELLEPGFKRSYARARQALQHASRHLTSEAFHELRKSVKTHQYQLQLLEPVWPELLKARRHELSDLSEHLGDHHDLSLLIPDLSAQGFSEIASAATERSAEVEQLILRQARKLLAEQPRHLSGTLGDWFDNYQLQPLPTRPNEQ